MRSVVPISGFVHYKSEAIEAYNIPRIQTYERELTTGDEMVGIGRKRRETEGKGGKGRKQSRQ
jgi:hypothetical protein